jgi:hypothetical protein
MDLSKKLILLRHIDSFIKEQYSLGESTEDILGMLSEKGLKYEDKVSESDTSNSRKTYLINYSLFLKKKVIDFQHFRNKEEFKNSSDQNLFTLINFRDKLIFRTIFN